MESVGKYIENYGFIVSSITDGKVNGYYCKNEISQSEFIIDFTKKNLKNPSIIYDHYTNIYGTKINIVFLIEVDENIDEILEFIEKNKKSDLVYLIYDKDDEIEFFLKDLWNTIINLHNGVNWKNY
ncbi:hypothetical protein SH2C18_01470 [Clostridium sediminicola]|uniref:hypothetical protein n=1 Tax=Clostridium sediminicola TaxID=3114879 RepID=UPI0031F25773